jgi:hypothetical protein
LINFHFHFFSTVVKELGGSSSPTPVSQPQIPREEPEKIKRWREEQKTRLEQKGVYYNEVLIHGTNCKVIIVIILK